jgi:hypothetical protein
MDDLSATHWYQKEHVARNARYCLMLSGGVTRSTEIGLEPTKQCRSINEVPLAQGVHEPPLSAGACHTRREPVVDRQK